MENENKGVVEIDETQGTITLTQEAFDKMQKKHNFDNATARIQAKQAREQHESEPTEPDNDRIAQLEAQNRQILEQQAITLFETQYAQAIAETGVEGANKAMIANLLRSGSYNTPEDAIKEVYASQIEQRQAKPSPSPSGSQASEKTATFNDDDMEKMFSNKIK